jgi:hypothetical protein
MYVSEYIMGKGDSYKRLDGCRNIKNNKQRG